MNIRHNATQWRFLCMSARPAALACLLLGVAFALSAWLGGDSRQVVTLLTAWAGVSVSTQGCARRWRAHHTSSTESR